MNKCVFGYCKAWNKEEQFDCQKCGEKTKLQGYTGCVYATRKENIKSYETK